MEEDAEDAENAMEVLLIHGSALIAGPAGLLVALVGVVAGSPPVVRWGLVSSLCGIGMATLSGSVINNRLGWPTFRAGSMGAALIIAGLLGASAWDQLAAWGRGGETPSAYVLVGIASLVSFGVAGVTAFLVSARPGRHRPRHANPGPWALSRFARPGFIAVGLVLGVIDLVIGILQIL